MTVRYVLDLQVSGDGPVETSIRENAAAIKREFGEHSSAYHEVMAHIAMVAMRHEWMLADMYRGYERQREERLAKARRREEVDQ